MNNLATSLPEGSYSVDPAHSHVGFSVKHMGIATVRGKFEDFSGRVELKDGELTAEGTVKVDSITTGQPDRDSHLKSGDFFLAEEYPTLTFRVTNTEGTTDDLELTGDITIRGVTKPITLKGEATAGGQDPWGNERIGFDLSGKLNRQDFGLSWSQTLANNSLLVSNDVKLQISASLVKAA